MSDLLSAMQTKDSLTENGMATNSSSLNLCVDLFFQIGAMRGQDKTRLINAFTKAFAEDQQLHSEKFLRIFNELPAVVLILAVILVVVKPF